MPFNRISSGNPGEWKYANLIAAIVILVLGCIYVGNTWSPSSYGHVLLKVLGYKEGGPVQGHPRPIRSDEWAVATPLTQATVNNGFERYNKTSLYGEDLRINYGMPIHDWGILFKPTMWLYGVVNPAYAYSFHWFALAALFIVGYAWLFRWLGAAPVVGFALSAGLFYTGFTQFWWNEKGPLFALFPWVVLPFATRLPLAVKAAWFYWMAVAWIVTNLYPPVQVSLAFVGLVLVLAKEPQLFRPRPLLVIGSAAVLAAGTAALYLWDYLQATTHTLYPGGRNTSGGNIIDGWRFFISWLFPAVNFNRDFESLIGQNICEIGTVGLYYFLLALCFLDYSRWKDVRANPQQMRVIAVLGVGYLMMFAWMAFPIPSWAGKILLWNNVQPARMQYASGVLLTLLMFSLVHALGLKLTRARLGLFCILAVVGWWAFKYTPGKKYNEDLGILLLVIPAFLFAWWRPAQAHATLAVTSLVAGVLLFARFNPLQPAWPIFNLQPNATVQEMQQLAKFNWGILAVPNLPGAVGNGLGFRSLSHVTAVPQLPFWRSHFSEMPADEFNQIFNRYSHINPTEETRPRLIQADSVAVPLDRALKPLAARYAAAPTGALEMGGNIDQIVLKDGMLTIQGWHDWPGGIEDRTLEISLAGAQGAPTHRLVLRTDVFASSAGKVPSLSGFMLKIPYALDNAHPPICIVALDRASGRRWLLHNPPDLPYCNAQQTLLAKK